MRIDEAGNVGIASSSPGYPLTVNGNVWSSGAFIGSLNGTVSAANVSTGVFGYPSASNDYAFPAAVGVGTNSTAGLPSNGLYVSGSVGIGTASPGAYKLNVNGNFFAGDVDKSTIDMSNASGGGYIQMGDAGDNYSGSRLYLGNYNSDSSAQLISDKYTYVGDVNNDNSGTYLFVDSHLNTITLHNEVNSAEAVFDFANSRIRFDNVKVGIGNTAPSYNLDVTGTFRATGNWSLGGGASSTLNMNGQNVNAVNKLSVTTIDPLYDIGGAKYSTYASAIAGGVKEEYVGRGQLQMTNDKSNPNDQMYQYVVDFDKVERGSDLWVWRKVIDFSPDNVEVFTTPVGLPIPISYLIEDNKIIFRANSSAVAENCHLSFGICNSVDFSYRLVGNRFDWRDWPTYAKDQNESANLIVK